VKVAVVGYGKMGREVAAVLRDRHHEPVMTLKGSDFPAGCAVGIDRAGAPRFTRAFGEADLEYDIPNKPETIFEAGSISKQFTAAATVLLALDGKLNLADDIRKYVPELPT